MNNKIWINLIINFLVMYFLGLGYSSNTIKLVFILITISNIYLLFKTKIQDFKILFLSVCFIIIMFSILLLAGNNLYEVLDESGKIIYYVTVFNLYMNICTKYKNNSELAYKVQLIILTISISSIILYLILNNPITINVNGYQYSILFKENFFARDALTGPFMQPNEYGDLQIFLIILSLYNIRIYKNISIVSIIVAFVSIFLSISRTALLISSLIVIVYFIYNASRKTKRITALSTIFIIPISLIVLMLNPDIFSNIMGTKFNQSSLFSGREQLWNASCEIIKLNPWYGTPIRDIRWSYDYLVDSSLQGLGAHNMYLHLLVKVGVIGVVFIFIYVISIILIRLTEKWDKNRKFIIISLAIAVCVRGVMESGFIFVFGIRILIVWIIFGIAMANMKYKLNSNCS